MENILKLAISDGLDDPSLDEGLGTVYERLVLDDFFRRWIQTHNIRRVLEAPIYGMTGLTGINSFEFVRQGASLTLVADKQEHLDESRRLWQLLGLADRVDFRLVEDLSALPFADRSFDFVWNFAALWHLQDAPALVEELARVSSNLVFISVQNTRQPGFFLRKHFIDRELFATVHERWLRLGPVKEQLRNHSMAVLKEGVFDVPPFPDTAMPVGRLLERLKLRKPRSAAQAAQKRWSWNIVKHYAGQDPGLRERVGKFMFLERSPLPTALKALWAHHRFVLAGRSGDGE